MKPLLDTYKFIKKCPLCNIVIEPKGFEMFSDIVLLGEFVTCIAVTGFGFCCPFSATVGTATGHDGRRAIVLSIEDYHDITKS